jgi:hypothetical protein
LEIDAMFEQGELAIGFSLAVKLAEVDVITIQYQSIISFENWTNSIAQNTKLPQFPFDNFAARLLSSAKVASRSQAAGSQGVRRDLPEPG